MKIDASIGVLLVPCDEHGSLGSPMRTAAWGTQLYVTLPAVPRIGEHVYVRVPGDDGPVVGDVMDVTYECGGDLYPAVVEVLVCFDPADEDNLIAAGFAPSAEEE